MKGFRGGVRAALPVVLGYLGIGLAAGVVERAAGLSHAEILLLSTVLYAGSAQFVLAGLLALGAAPAAIVSTVFLVNLRHLLLSAALAPALRGLPAWKNALIGLQLTDETFVVAAGRRPLSAAWMAGLNLSAWAAWAAANVAGAALSGLAADTRALGFALPSMFAALLVLQLRLQRRLRPALAVAAVAAALGVGAQLALAGPWAVVLATVLGATVGLALQRWTSAPSS
ncbi:MAG TPA: AzlC family ABC transporter permease [Burkholderiales bacterium]|nr:AzlC family ABC transporter permease [Burkholderiales bacterium]